MGRGFVVGKTPEVLDWPDLIVSSVATAEPIISRQMVEKAMVAGTSSADDDGSRCSRNIAVDVREVPNIQLSDIDGLTEVVEENKKAREEEIPRALALIDDQIDGFMRWQPV